MLFQAFCQKMKIMGPTATHLAQFCAIQFPLQILASCYCQGLKFCMDGRNTMLHGLKLRVLPKNKILSLTAAHAAQFGVFQPHPWALPSCKVNGFKFCMHGRNAMLHQKKMGILPQNTDCRPHAPTPMRGHFGAEHPNVAANHHTMACTL